MLIWNSKHKITFQHIWMSSALIGTVKTKFAKSFHQVYPRTGESSATNLQLLRFLYPVFTDGWYIQPFLEPYNQPSIDNFS